MPNEFFKLTSCDGVHRSAIHVYMSLLNKTKKVENYGAPFFINKTKLGHFEFFM
jgi:hypothetical protein